MLQPMYIGVHVFKLIVRPLVHKVGSRAPPGVLGGVPGGPKLNDQILTNPIWASGVPLGSILDLFCFLLLKGKLPLKIVDRQAHNATQRVAL